ncbi:MAG: hypothetical protein CMJ49_01070 [Planctomycetaceae bacterium]|nr:hypothetical protein [Planctomycetaceae bacterium]
MKRYLGIIIRIVVAAVGLGYVAHTLTWQDSVELPPDYVLNGRAITADAAQTFRIDAQTDNRYTLELVDGSTVDLPHDALRDDGHPPKFVPGLINTVSDADLWWLLAAIAVIAPVYLFQASRWGLLMHCRGLPTPPWRTFRLLMVGCFFNSFMPGTTGGDVMKAIYVARGAQQKTAAIISVIVDRIIGLVALLLLGVVAGSFMFSDERAHDTILFMWALAAVALLGAVVYLSGRIRRALGIDWLIRRFPDNSIIRKIDQATVAYRRHPVVLLMALALAVPVHVLTIFATAFSGWSIGVTTELAVLMAVLPLVILAGSIPITFMGFGVMEPLAIALLVAKPDAAGLVVATDATTNQVVTMVVLFRVYLVLYSMIGAIFLMRGHLHLQEIDDPAPDLPGDADQPVADGA